MCALTALALLVGAPVSTSTVWVAPQTPAVVRSRLEGQLAGSGWRAEVSGDEARRPWLVVRPLDGDFELELRTADGRRHARRLDGLGVGSAGAEGVALVLRGALAALARGDAPAGLRAFTPAPSGPELRGGVGVSAGWLGPERPSAGVDGQLSLHDGALGGGLRLAGRWSPEVEARGVGVQALRLDASGFGQLDLGTFLARGSLGLAAWRRSTRAAAPGLVQTPTSWTMGLLIGVELGVRARWAGFDLELTAGLDASLPRPRYVVAGGEELAGPAALQPSIRVACVWR